MHTIAVDATGGDHGPVEALKAAAEVSLEGGVRCLLLGDTGIIETELARHAHDPRRLVVADPGRVSDVGGLPALAAGALPLAAALVRSGEADAVVSTGDTAACVRTWLATFPLVPGATRPALASFFPRRPPAADRAAVGLLLDVGATLRCHPRDYPAFALMGAAYYQGMTGECARVGLLNVGTEGHKGGEALARSATLLADLGERIDFVGNVEGTELLNGTADVILTDGFTGNVLLKTLEGIADTAGALVRDALTRHWLWRLGILLLSDGLQALRRATDYAEYGGSPLLGFDTLLVKAHGRSRAPAIKNAIRAAARALDSALPERTATALSALRDLGNRSWLRIGRRFHD
jgi:glycerol-3-phosphate acyltransferase PlsX